MTVTFMAHGRAKRYTHTSSGELAMEADATVYDVKQMLGIPQGTLIRGVVNGEAVPDSLALTEGMHIGLVILVTAG